MGIFDFNKKGVSNRQIVISNHNGKDDKIFTKVKTQIAADKISSHNLNDWQKEDKRIRREVYIAERLRTEKRF